MSALAFELPAAQEAPAPPEQRGLARDEVRLLVARRAGRPTIEHAQFKDLPQLLAPGDLLVVNVSATLPAALDGHRVDGASVRVHVSTRAPGLDPSWRVVELRSPDGSRPAPARAGGRVNLGGGGPARAGAAVRGERSLDAGPLSRAGNARGISSRAW
jgi:S-adenosylmethionine:tRNA ribosyltransferase-isomerase